MKKWRSLLALIILMVGKSSLRAHFSDEFTIGAYSLLKSSSDPEWVTFNSNMLGLMQSMGNYNASICENPLPASVSVSSADVLIQEHYNHQIDPMLCDYHIGFDSTGNLNSAGPHAVSTSNYWLFEAEFDSTNCPSGYNDDTNKSNMNFYKFTNWYEDYDRIGYSTEDTDNTPSREVWVCPPDTLGIALQGLRYRYPKANANDDILDPGSFDAIGSEFRFAQWDRQTWDETGPLGQHYLSWNKLYVRYVFKVVSITSGVNALKFAVLCKNFQTGLMEPVPMKNIMNPGALNDSLAYTFTELQQYSTPVDPLNLEDLYRAITFEIDMDYLRGLGAASDDDTYLNTAGYWNCSLFAIDPYLVSFGNGTINLDYVEIFDKMYDKLDETPPTEAITWLNNRFDDYGGDSLSKVKSFYTLDEPQFPHFASYSRLNSAISSSSIGSKKSFATINWGGGQYKKDPLVRSRFSLPELFTREENGFGASELMIDYYPLQPANNWNATNQDNLVSGGNPDQIPIQGSLDYKLLAHYYGAKQRCLQRNIPLYVVPVSAGRWMQFPFDPGYWDYYMMPTGNMQKCLQLLPLCYGVDGVINWKLYDRFDSSSLLNGEQLFALVTKDGDTIDYNTPQFLAICQANAKLKLYGNLIKERQLQWMNALCLKDTGVFISSVYGDVGDMLTDIPSQEIGTCLDGIYAFDPDYMSNLSPYQGYVQLGIYQDSNSCPFYVLVNRRTDFVDNTSGTMQYLTPNQLRTHYNESGYASGFHAAPSQTAEFELSNSAYSHFGPTIGLYDPYSKHFYTQEDTEIKVEIEPGDGLLLEMVGLLPPVVNSDMTFRNKLYIEGNVTIGGTRDVVIEPNTEVVIMPNTHITLGRNASLDIGGAVTIRDGVRFTIASDATVAVSNGSFDLSGDLLIDGGGVFTVADSVVCHYAIGACVTVSDTSMVVMSGTHYLKIGNTIQATESSLMKYLNATVTMGRNSCILASGSGLEFISSSISISIDNPIGNSIQAKDLSVLCIEDSDISQIPIEVQSSDLVMEHSRIYISEDDTGIIINNPFTDRSVSFVNNNGRSGFWGISGNPTGLKVESTHSPVIIRNTDFYNLSLAIHKEVYVAAPDSIFNCGFEDCGNGINSLSVGSVGRIDTCHFTNISGVGITLSGSVPTISDCTFNACGKGIKFDGAFYSPLESGVYDSAFNLCGIAIESRASNPRIQDCSFNLNEVGLECQSDSNLNLSSQASNWLKNEIVNIRFLDSGQCSSYIQLSAGHNDFYHFGLNTTDFYFDENYLSATGYVIDANENWFEHDAPRFNDPQYTENVKFDSLDPSPNTTGSSPDGTNRYLLALHLEATGQFDQAVALYQTILDDQLEAEVDYCNGCMDGLFRIELLSTIHLEQLEQYIELQIGEYTAVDSSFCKLLSDYLIKTNVAQKDYQRAVDLIQSRIDDPVSLVDSLRAVLDLEIVLQLAALEADKSAVVTKYAQYSYPNLDVFKEKHDEHWTQLYKLLRGDDSPVPPIPPLPLISKNYPNPFNPFTTIEFSIPATGRAKVAVYNIRGQRVRDLLDSLLDRGHHKLIWDGKDNSNRNVSSGIYFFKLDSGNRYSIRKAMLMK